MLLSRCLLTILVTIVANVTYKPCQTINNANHVNQIKTSFLQRSVAVPESPESVKAGETVDVVSNKLDDLKGGTAAQVDSKTTTEEVNRHEQDKSTVESAPKETEPTEEKDKASESSDSETKKEDTGVDVKTSENKEAEVKEHTDDTVKEKAPEGEGGDAKGKEEHGQDDAEEHEEDHSESQPVKEDEHAEDHKDEAEESKEHTETTDAEQKTGEEDHKQDVVDANGQNSDDKKAEETNDATATKEETEKPEESTEAAQKEEHVENHSSPEATSEAPAAENTVEAKESAPEHSEAPAAQGADEHGTSTHVEVVHEVKGHDGGASVDQHSQGGHSPEVATTDVAAPTQPSTSTQSEVAAHVPQSEGNQPAPQTEGTSVQHQGETGSSASTQQAPVVVDLNNLKEEEKEKVVKLWSKPSGDCSVDCSHSCKSSLTPSTQCVSQQGSTLSCSAFADSRSLTCPNGFTPCTQPNVTSLKSYTLKNGDQEVGALEVDGSNFNKCMGLALTTPNGVCDKDHLVANLLFTYGVLDLNYETSVAADKLTFSNLKIKNGDYKVCLFQRHEGSLQGMTLAVIWERLLNFLNPTSSTPEVKTVFVLDVGTLNVSD